MAEKKQDDAHFNVSLSQEECDEIINSVYKKHNIPNIMVYKVMIPGFNNVTWMPSFQFIGNDWNIETLRINLFFDKKWLFMAATNNNGARVNAVSYIKSLNHLIITADFWTCNCSNQEPFGFLRWNEHCELCNCYKTNSPKKYTYLEDAIEGYGRHNYPLYIN